MHATCSHAIIYSGIDLLLVCPYVHCSFTVECGPCRPVLGGPGSSYPDLFSLPEEKKQLY